MKKVLLLMAGVLLIGGTAMATTGTTGDWTENTVQDSVKVTVTVDEYAEITVGDDVVSTDAITSPDDTSTNKVNFTIANNSPVNVKAEVVDPTGLSTTVKLGDVDMVAVGFDFAQGQDLVNEMILTTGIAAGTDWYKVAAANNYETTVTLTVAAQ